MISTIIVIAIVLSVTVLSVGMSMVLLQLGLRWAKVSGVTPGRVVVATIIIGATQLVLYSAFRVFAPASNAWLHVLAVLEPFVRGLASCFVIMFMFRAGFFRSAQAWLPTVLTPIPIFLLSSLVLRPFVYEAHHGTSNAMAPTLLGKHWRGRCPECGQPNSCSPNSGDNSDEDIPRMICGNFHVHQVPDAVHEAFPPDCFLSARFLTPKRWDIVVFQHPEYPSDVYVKRLIGLPGETITFDGGAVWVNGTKVTVPDTLRGIEYVSDFPYLPGGVWGAKERPAVLGVDEYFVLGDFSAQSRDSRFWEQGAPGHSPFAVPRSYIRGVVTHIYWPPQRFRVLR